MNIEMFSKGQIYKTPADGIWRVVLILRDKNLIIFQSLYMFDNYCGALIDDFEKLDWELQMPQKCECGGL